MKKILTIMLALVMTLSVAAMCGCSVKFSENKQITVVVREDGSGTKKAFMEFIGLKDKNDKSGVIVATGTPAVLTEVKNNPHAIAYESLGFVTDEVKILKVDGVLPSVENIKNGTYKISRPLSVVYKEENMTGINAAYLKFLASAEAQEIISANGYVMVNETSEKYVIDADLSGSVAISGSTSLKPLMEKLAAKFEALQSGVKVSVGGGGSGTGYNDAQNGVSAFGMISENFVQTKATDCVYFTVAMDGIAMIVNKLNPVESLTMEQLKNIYDAEAGENAITVWKQIIG